jgi:hypothetical protein
MKRQLRERRDSAADRHDAALAHFPTREGKTFESELEAVVEELGAVAKAADTPSSDPVEVAKTYRWLGDACFDLGRGTDQTALTRGVEAYQRAEELLSGAEAPLEKAKLDFNYGNTLRGLSHGQDVGLLEAAQTRYESAVRTFRDHHLTDLVATVDQQLRSIDPQLRLARKQSEMQRGYGRLEELKGQLEGAGPAERERIMKELAELKRVPGRGDVGETVSEAFASILEQAEKHPERFEDAGAQLDALRVQIEALGSTLEDMPPKAEPSGGLQDQEQEIATALMERLRSEAEAGHVSADRAGQLGDIFKQFTDAMSESGDDLDSLSASAQKMRELTQQVMDAAMSPSWTTPAPEPGSRADRAVSILEPLKRHLMAEKGRSMLPSDEASAGTDLLTRLVKLEARIREAATDDGDLSELEGEVWRLAVAVQEHARRYHLVLAQPDFAMAKHHAKPKSVFFSGGDALLAAAEELAARDDLELLSDAGRGDRAKGRWNQLCSASMAVFDVGVPKGAHRTQVCYELGLALALGKPAVVAARPRQRLPFDVNLRPVRLAGERAKDAALLEEGIRHALGSITWGGGGAGLGSGPRETLAWLDRRFHQRLGQGSLRIALEGVERQQEDAVGFRRSLEQLLGMLGADAPTALLPAWPPAYPDSAAKPRCFHVMPFRPGWSKPTRDLAAELCDGNGWKYSRGDEAEAQRIIHGIWSEIGRASAVLVDITGHNPNVALELGLVHALGRPYRLIAQGDPEQHMFDSLEKVQIHRYGRGPGFTGFAEVVTDLLKVATA